MKDYFVYILATKKHGTLYVGVTNDLVRRIYEHKHDAAEGFTKKYQVHKLVYFEQTNSIEDAIEREKELKHFGRARKIALIESANPSWKDLYPEIAE
jgi:putative endonuclease